MLFCLIGIFLSWSTSRHAFAREADLPLTMPSARPTPRPQPPTEIPDTLAVIQGRWERNLPSLFPPGTRIREVTLVRGAEQAGRGNMDARLRNTPALIRFRDRANPHARRNALFFTAQSGSRLVDVLCELDRRDEIPQVSNRPVMDHQCYFYDPDTRSQMTLDEATRALGRPIFLNDNFIAIANDRDIPDRRQRGNASAVDTAIVGGASNLSFLTQNVFHWSCPLVAAVPRRAISRTDCEQMAATRLRDCGLGGSCAANRLTEVWSCQASTDRCYFSPNAPCDGHDQQVGDAQTAAQFHSYPEGERPRTAQGGQTICRRVPLLGPSRNIAPRQPAPPAR